MPNANYLELLPEEELTPLIKCFWISVNDSGSELYFTTLPDGYFEVVVIYREGGLKNVLLCNILSEAYDMKMAPGERKIGA